MVYSAKEQPKSKKRPQSRLVETRAIVALDDRRYVLDGPTATLGRSKECECVINDPNIKATLQSRQQAVRSNFKLVQMYADGARKAFDPFLKGNKEIVQALSIDLSPPMVVSLAPAMDRAYADGQALKQRIAALQHALDSMANGASPIGH